MVMSKADSILNTTSVMFSHDILAPLNIRVNNQLGISKRFSIMLGSFAATLTIYGKNFLSIILSSNALYMRVVTVPLLLAILGFRSTKKSLLIGIWRR